MDKPELQSFRLLEKEAPTNDELVVAEVVSFTDDVVHCCLPMYSRLPVILPTRHINIRRGRKVRDYVKVGQLLVASVYTIYEVDKEDGTQVRQIDLSIKSIQEEDKQKTMEMFHRANKVHQVICAASDYKIQAVEALYKEVRDIVRGIQEEQIEYDAYTYFQEILIDEKECANEKLRKSIQQRMEMPSYTAEKEVRFQTNEPNGVQIVSERLTEIATHPGVKVFVVAPPLYRITCTATTKAKAEHLLEMCEKKKDSIE
jgi:translation initiation factor 2 alpha subunit (eIF-2alpha)